VQVSGGGKHWILQLTVSVCKFNWIIGREELVSLLLWGKVLFSPGVIMHNVQDRHRGFTSFPFTSGGFAFSFSLRVRHPEKQKFQDIIEEQKQENK
ncbi:hypothetical protein HN51_066675, partial [Arachis hypogaea]